MLSALQSKLFYCPSPYSGFPPELPEQFLAEGGHMIEVHTKEGRQVSWLRKPPRSKPNRFWIVCGGNGDLALRMADDFPASPRIRDAWLFIDYPGYGFCDGIPSPETIDESLRAVIPAALDECGMEPDELQERGIVLGHSLGAAAALMAADAFGICRAILLSPFTSAAEMAKAITGLPLGWLVRHRYNNRVTLERLVGRGGRAWIIHGTEDEVIPVEMGRELAEEHPDEVRYFEVPGAGHNDIFSAEQEFEAAMREARKP
jgi:pimeloyl-ACP methyl ester carboxylesterase